MAEENKLSDVNPDAAVASALLTDEVIAELLVGLELPPHFADPIKYAMLAYGQHVEAETLINVMVKVIREPTAMSMGAVNARDLGEWLEGRVRSTLAQSKGLLIIRAAAHAIWKQQHSDHFVAAVMNRLAGR